MIKIHLSRILGERRISQAEIARRTGIRPNAVGEIYNELNVRINLEHLNSLCNVLECDIASILEHIPDEPTTYHKKAKTRKDK